MISFAFCFPVNATTSFFICELFFNQKTFLSSYRVIKVNTVIMNKENQQFKCNFSDAVFKQWQNKHKHVLACKKGGEKVKSCICEGCQKEFTRKNVLLRCRKEEKEKENICSIFEYLFKYLFNRKSFKHKAGLSMNDMRSHLHTATHANIYLGLLLSYMQNFIWWVNCTPTLQQVCYVIILQIIHLQLHVEFPFAEIHCII